jgi:hypothetical protein
MFYWEILSEVAKRFQNFNGGEEGFRAVMVEGDGGWWRGESIRKRP